jgi:hypothetical protein
MSKPGVNAHIYVGDKVGIKEKEEVFSSLQDEIQKFLKDRYRNLNERIGCRSIIRSMIHSAVDKNSNSGGKNDCFPSVSCYTTNVDDLQPPSKKREGPDSYEFRCDSSIQNGVIVVDMTRISLLQAMEQSCSDDWDLSKVCRFLNTTSDEHNYSDDATKLTWWDRPLWAWKWDELVLGNGAMLSIDMAEKLRRTLPSSLSLKLAVSNVAEIPQVSFQGDWTFRLMLQTQHTLKERHSDKINPETKLESNLKEVKSKEDLLGAAAPDGEQGLLKPRPSPTQEAEFSNSTTPEVTLSQEQKSNRYEVSDGTGPPTMNADKVENCNNEIVFAPASDDECTPMTQSNSSETVPTMSESPTSVIQEIRQSQVDSQGVDLTMLSQLPPELRSEARLALAIQEQKREKKRPRPPVNSQLYRWLSTASSTSEATKSVPPTNSEPPIKKQNQTIKDFFAVT